MVRGALIDQNGMKKGAWSEDEDNKLRAYIQRYGHWNWRELPKYAGVARCGKSCRLRWMNYLRPDVKRGNFTKEEEDLILNTLNDHGNKWSVIAAKLPGRSDNEIKNHWHTHLKKLGKRNKTVPEEQLTHSSGICEAEAEEKQQSNEEREIPILVASSPPQTSEKGLMSSESSSSSENFSDGAVSGGVNWINELIGDFWTQPFLSDNDVIRDEYLSPSVSADHFLSPSSCHMILDDEFLWAYDGYIM